MRSRWPYRLVGGLVVFVALQVILTLTDSRPDPIRLALLVGTCTALLGLTFDAVGLDEPSWTLEIERPTMREAGDPRLGLYVGLLESHLSARSGDRSLRDRLVVLTDQVLRQRYGLRHDDPAAEELLGPELSAVLQQTQQRLSRAEIDRCLTTIEEL